MHLDRNDWDKFADEFHSRKTLAINQALVKSGLVEKTCGHHELVDELSKKTTWNKALKNPDGIILLTFSLFAWGMHEWEVTFEHSTVTGAVRKVRNKFEEAEKDHPINRDSVTGQAIKLIMLLIDCLDDCLAVENALNSSCIPALQHHSDEIINRCEPWEPSLRDLKIFAPGDRPIYKLLNDIIRTQLIFYRSVSKFAKSLLEYQNRSLDVLDLDEAVQHLKNAELELGPDVLASELPPYRRVLRALRRRMLDESLPDVQFESVKVIYIYPFTFDGLSGKEACKRTLDRMTGGPPHSLTESPSTLAGIRPVSVGRADMTDLWPYSGVYTGVDVVMPDLTVNTQDDQVLKNYRSKVRITTLGNHYVRIEQDLANPEPHEINQCLRRASSRWMGRETITSDGCERLNEWARFIEYANQVSTALQAQLTSNRLEQKKPDPISSFKRANMQFHALLEIRSAAVRTPDGGRREATEDDIRRFAGALLLQPLTRLAIAPEEWMCYRVPHWTNLIEEDSFQYDFSVGTANTTVLCMPATPNWAYLSYEESVELVASLPSLLRLWERQLRDKHYVTSEKMLPAQDIQSPDEFALFRRELHNAVVEVRTQRTYLTPSELVGSGQHRAFLDSLFRVAKIADSLHDLDNQLETADLIHDRAAAHELRLRDTLRDQRYADFQYVLQFIVALVGLFSFASFIALFEQEVFGSSESVLQTRFHPAINVILTVLLYGCAVGFTVLGLRWARRKVDDPNAPDTKRFAIMTALRRLRKTDSSLQTLPRS